MALSREAEAELADRDSEARPADLFNYQERMYNLAVDTNLICVLPTGAGKTRIAVELARTAILKFPDRHVIFLAPTIPLAQQQQNTLQDELRSVVCHGFYGGKRFTPPSTWQKASIIVATPQTLVNELERDGFEWHLCSLLILDECHHTDKRHPYHVIMSHYADTAGFAKPRVLGLTASPVCGIAFSDHLVVDLCERMCCALSYVDPRTDAELGCQVPTPQLHAERPARNKRTEELACAIDDFFGECSRFLDACCHHAATCSEMRKVLSRPVSSSEEGLIDASNVLQSVDVLVRQLKKARMDGIRCKLCLDAQSVLLQLISASTAASVSLPRTTADSINELCSSFQFEELRPLERVFRNADRDNILPSDLQRLVDILVEHEKGGDDEPFSAIVFVQQRRAARHLAQFLSDHSRTKLFVRPRAFIGQASRVDSPEDRMSCTKLREAMDEFRSGQVNLLVATTVAEEGLDVPSCRLVIRLDTRFTPIQMIQSRGRARFRPSHFYVINSLDDDNEWFNAACAAESQMVEHLSLAVDTPIHRDKCVLTMWEVSPPPLAPRRSLITALPSIPLIQPRSHGQALAPGDYVSQLNHVLQLRGANQSFRHVRIGGSDHQPLFLGTITICLRNLRRLEFTSDYACSNSKDAKQAAAGVALRGLGLKL